MIYAIEPPDRNEYAGKGRAPRRWRTVYGPKEEVTELLTVIPGILRKDRTDLANGTHSMVFVDSSATATMMGRGVQLTNKYEVAKMLIGKPLTEVA